jgi:hypothetical protein
MSEGTVCPERVLRSAPPWYAPTSHPAAQYTRTIKKETPGRPGVLFCGLLWRQAAAGSGDFSRVSMTRLSVGLGRMAAPVLTGSGW